MYVPVQHLLALSSVLLCARSICKQLAAAKVVNRGAKAISLTKGMRVRAEGPQLISQMVSRILGIDCSVLMGANIAGDIAREEVRWMHVQSGGGMLGGGGEANA
eukprot:1159870-Pelagomonas_calceolata.AAC.4